jgi:hypothetical protein
MRFRCPALLAAALLGAAAGPGAGFDKPTGAPLVLSNIETEQSVPLAIESTDRKTISCVTIRMHWSPGGDVKAGEEAASFSLDIPAGNPGAAIFLAQLWNASLASSMAWQQPWQGARWKILQTPASDGTGIDAALAVGMIATSARRPYPKETLVIGNLHPDGSLGAVSRLVERLDAAAAAGINRVIIPDAQRFDPDSSGQMVNIVRHASDLHLECIPVRDLYDATEVVMNDPLPDRATDATPPTYNTDIAAYIGGFAGNEKRAVETDLFFAPKPDDLKSYPPHAAELWRSVYADNDAGQDAYKAGQVYVAYQLFMRAESRIQGLRALVGQSRVTFDVKSTLAASDALRQRLHALMSPPAIDRGELQSGLLVAEMSDWAYDIDATLEGAQLVTKQTFSQRTDATDAEKDRAREAILFANDEARTMLDGADLYLGLLAHLSTNDQLLADVNASRLLPQLIPAQLASAQLFTEGLQPVASQLRDGLLFDPRLVAYISVLRRTKADWDSLQHKKELEAENTPSAPVATGAGPVTPRNGTGGGEVGFDPNNTYAPPHTVLTVTDTDKKLSDVAQCLIWVNNDCEIAALDAKYLRLGGSIDPQTHEWKLGDRSRLDALLQTADAGARDGMAMASKAGVDPAVLAMIYEKANHQRLHGDDAAALDALRNYWRCSLLGNMCWQLAHSRKAEAVDLSAEADQDKDKDKPKPDDGGKPETKKDEGSGEKTATSGGKPAPPTNAPSATPPPAPPATAIVPPPPKPAPPTEVHAAIAVTPPAPPTNETVIPVAPVATNVVVIPVAPAVTNVVAIPVAPAVTNVVTVPVATNLAVAPVAPATNAPAEKPPPRALPVTLNDTNAPAAINPDDANIPVAPIAHPQDYSGAGNTTNAPVIGPVPPAAPTHGETPGDL